MKKLTLFLLLVTFMTPLWASNVLTLKIVKTHEESGVDVSNNDGEYEGDPVDKMFDDDLDMGWEGEDNNQVMTTFLRFENVTIPQGATIDSVRLNIYAHEDEVDPAYITIYAEGVDNSAAFVDTELYSQRTKTTANVAWDITENWTMWQPYQSPDLKVLVQEVINRAGWSSGNALTLFLQGEDQGFGVLTDNARDFESFENIEDPEDYGDGFHHPERIPELVIYYTLPQECLTLTIVKTHEESGVDVSNNDGEYEGDPVDKMFDDDLDMGWEGEDNNQVMTTFLRFVNVTIPQGSVVDSAYLYIYAHEDEVDPAYITAYAEGVDNSAAFVDTELYSQRTKTTASVAWDITENWTMWQQYKSPDFKTIVQEVINRPGWTYGNALTLFLQGEDQGFGVLTDNARDFESFENIEDPEDYGDGLHHPERIPQLKIWYVPSTTISNEEVLAPSNEVNIYSPMNGVVMISLPNNTQAKLAVYTISGNLLQTQTLKSEKSSIAIIGKGIFIINVVQDGKMFSKKVIVK